MKCVATIFRIQNIHSTYIQSLLILFLIIFLFPKTSFSQTIWSEDFEGNWVVDWHVDNGTWELELQQADSIAPLMVIIVPQQS